MMRDEPFRYAGWHLGITGIQPNVSQQVLFLPAFHTPVLLLTEAGEP